MADTDQQDRRLPATQRKLDKARQAGQVPRSRDLANFGSLAGGILLIGLAGPWAHGWMREGMSLALQFSAQELAQADFVWQRLAALVWRMLAIVVPLGLLMGLMGVLASGLVGGWNFTMDAVLPRFDKFNPLRGLGHLFQREQVIDTLKRCGQALLLGVIGAAFLHSHLLEFTALMGADLQSALARVGKEMLAGLWWLMGLMGLMALIDAPLQKFMYAERMKMSYTEVKQEFKDAEGNQEVKGKIKVRMREASRRRMLAAVPKADMVVMNPSHYAVALQYNDQTMGAPRVVAKGADLLALAIRDAAQMHRVPVLQAPPLARALYVHAELDREVPAALFAAVAQVLAYVYQLRLALKGEAQMPSELGRVAVPPGLDPLEDEAAAGRAAA